MKHREIPELIEADSFYRKKRNETRKALEKVKKLEAKFYFLDRIVQPRKDTDTKKDDVELEFAILDLFKSIGFKCEKPTSDADVDVKAKFKEIYFGIEVKNGKYVGENDTFQPFKHKLLNDDTFHPILIFNNARDRKGWDLPRIKIAVNMKFGLLLASELKKGYLKLKKGKITIGQFITQLQKIGEIKFSRKEMDKAYKSEAS
ncbi:hypothetical protein [Prolixibacter sp. SD074]|uniref:hypothetical protein n=1 Tax=Prolixibacter sp. SD074 TaxID=2652391 RepID=UPI001283DE8D|nr:hypothetical protein [Prolixibacter sp. SD074]GET28186.1 hypothetical protein SD074_03880 [Prolixibacter sp. SD074]